MGSTTCRASRVLGAAVLLGVIAAGVLRAQPEAGTHTVLTARASLRAGPTFGARLAGTVVRGARVTRIEERGGWLRVRAEDGTEGWLHRSAVTAQRYEVRTEGRRDPGTGATVDEVALAAKGFSPEIERADRSSAQDADYNAVDRIEAWVALAVSDEEVQAFMREGELAPRETEPGEEE